MPDWLVTSNFPSRPIPSSPAHISNYNWIRALSYLLRYAFPSLRVGLSGRTDHSELWGWLRWLQRLAGLFLRRLWTRPVEKPAHHTRQTRSFNSFFLIDRSTWLFEWPELCAYVRLVCLLSCRQPAPVSSCRPFQMQLPSANHTLHLQERERERLYRWITWRVLESITLRLCQLIRRTVEGSSCVRWSSKLCSLREACPLIKFTGLSG